MIPKLFQDHHESRVNPRCLPFKLMRHIIFYLNSPENLLFKRKILKYWLLKVEICQFTGFLGQNDLDLDTNLYWNKSCTSDLDSGPLTNYNLILISSKSTKISLKYAHFCFWWPSWMTSCQIFIFKVYKWVIMFTMSILYHKIIFLNINCVVFNVIKAWEQSF